LAVARRHPVSGGAGAFDGWRAEDRFLAFGMYCPAPAVSRMPSIFSPGASRQRGTRSQS
jgi:hypothetical protein